jgi:flagellar biosynthesis/type III secretory pathway protein FliH
MKDTQGNPITEEEFMKDIGHGVERTQENNSEWQYRFLKTGTEYGFGDLSAMVNMVSEILAEARSDSYTNGYRDGYDEGKKIVLSEVEKEVEKCYAYEHQITKVIKKDISIILNNLRVKTDTCSGSGGTQEKFLRP